jgi:hypothetical protein
MLRAMLISPFILTFVCGFVQGQCYIYEGTKSCRTILTSVNIPIENTSCDGCVLYQVGPTEPDGTYPYEYRCNEKTIQIINTATLDDQRHYKVKQVGSGYTFDDSYWWTKCMEYRQCGGLCYRNPSNPSQNLTCPQEYIVDGGFDTPRLKDPCYYVMDE